MIQQRVFLLSVSSLVLLFSMAAQAIPRQILIVRHAEKPTVGDEGIHLSERGRERASALPSFFRLHPEMNNNGAPVAVYAASPKLPTGSVRAFETITPTADHFGLPVNVMFKSGQEELIAEDILNNPDYEGKTVIICWVRDELPLLGNALGIQTKLSWPSSVFDRAWKITYDATGAHIKSVQQHLLVGDQ